ncbi:MAG: hypothetical protein H0W72_05870 [Planctomycetes bacterium]|nr:hypothetical protein [Planctomycetota bacterium]
MANADILGGLPLLSVMGTPRTMGDGLGQRLKPRLQVLTQYLSEQLAAEATPRLGRSPTPNEVRALLAPGPSTVTALEPGLAMELESMAHAAELTIADLLLIHGYSDLLSHLGCNAPVWPSTYLAFGPEQTASGRPLMVLVWEIDPTLLPYVVLVHRIPSHGPASLALTLAGLHPVVWINEAGLAVASNEMRVADGAPGHFTTHLVASMSTAPSFEDAIARAKTGPRWGGRAIHLLDAHGDRCTLELTGERTVRLPDQLKSAPRVHTNSALAEEIKTVTVSDNGSRTRLETIAGKAVRATAVEPEALLSWFGLGGTESLRSGAMDPHNRTTQITLNPESVIVVALEPGTRRFQVRRGNARGGFESKLI